MKYWIYYIAIFFYIITKLFLGVEGPLRKREKSPGVKFSEEVYDFEERQYQTVHAGCEIRVKPGFPERSRSGRYSRKSSSGSGTRPSIVDWPMGKLSWLKDRQKSGSKSGGDFNFTIFFNNLKIKSTFKFFYSAYKKIRHATKMTNDSSILRLN